MQMDSVFVHMHLRAGMEDSLRRSTTVVHIHVANDFILHIYVPCDMCIILIKDLSTHA
jgi:hypothetical protein